jgi:glycosyltransferase involved in cell wall biosynthesis
LAAGLLVVSVIVPAYNEEATIVEILERVNAQRIEGVELEVLVSDDGSRDRTVDLLETRPELYRRLIRAQRNGGKGAAVRRALEVATGDYVLFQDADLEYDPADYDRLLKPVLLHGADVVMGSRLTGAEIARVHYYWHRAGNRWLTWFFDVLNNTTFTDIYSGYLIYRRSLLAGHELRSEGWEQHAEILSLVVRRAKVIYEVPINYHGRTYEEGKKIRGWDALQVLGMIARMRLRA